MAQKTVIKVCGITHPAEARQLDELGVDFLGFNFYPKSKRYIEPEKALDIIDQLENAHPVGIFVNEYPQKVRQIFDQANLARVQLHGSESVDYMLKLGLKTIKAIGVAGADDIPDAPVPACDTLLFDTKDTENFGGTGRSFDWKLLDQAGHNQPFLIAGGLGPHNLLQAVEESRPWGVDLNSKVEDSPGRKNIGLVEECLRILGR